MGYHIPPPENMGGKQGLHTIVGLGELPLCDSHLLQEYVSISEEGNSYCTLGSHFYFTKYIMFQQEVNFCKFVNLSQLSMRISDFMSDESAVQRWLDAMPKTTIFQLGISDIKMESNFWSSQNGCQLTFMKERAIASARSGQIRSGFFFIIILF